MDATLLRKIAKNVLSAHGKSNPVSVKKTGFECSRHHNDYYNVTVKEWKPDPSADSISREIKEQADAEKLGVIMTFDGKGFIQG
jgi:hypothetical protein